MARMIDADALVKEMGLHTYMQTEWTPATAWEEPEINPCRGCIDYDGRGGCKSNGGCGADMKEVEENG